MTQRDIIQVKEGMEPCYLTPPSWVNEKPRATIKSNFCPAVGGREVSSHSERHTPNFNLELFSALTHLVIHKALVALASSEWRNQQVSGHLMELHNVAYFGGKGSQGEDHLFHQPRDHKSYPG